MGKVVRVQKLIGKAGELQDLSREIALLMKTNTDPQLGILKGHIDEIISENNQADIGALPYIDKLIEGYCKQIETMRDKNE